MSCDARIRPFPNSTEISCDGRCVRPDASGLRHGGALLDYAYPGSRTDITWAEDDRRTFHGAWPGACSAADGCTLPAGHRGRCAL